MILVLSDQYSGARSLFPNGLSLRVAFFIQRITAAVPNPYILSELLLRKEKKASLFRTASQSLIAVRGSLQPISETVTMATGGSGAPGWLRFSTRALLWQLVSQELPQQKSTININTCHHTHESRAMYQKWPSFTRGVSHSFLENTCCGLTMMSRSTHCRVYAHHLQKECVMRLLLPSTFYKWDNQVYSVVFYFPTVSQISSEKQI